MTCKRGETAGAWPGGAVPVRSLTFSRAQAGEGTPDLVAGTGSSGCPFPRSLLFRKRELERERWDGARTRTCARSKSRERGNAHRMPSARGIFGRYPRERGPRNATSRGIAPGHPGAQPPRLRLRVATGRRFGSAVRSLALSRPARGRAHALGRATVVSPWVSRRLGGRRLPTARGERRRGASRTPIEAKGLVPGRRSSPAGGPRPKPHGPAEHPSCLSTGRNGSTVRVGYE